MDRDEVPVNCEQVHKGIWRQAKQDEGGLEASDSKKKGEQDGWCCESIIGGEASVH